MSGKKAKKWKLSVKSGTGGNPGTDNEINGHISNKIIFHDGSCIFELSCFFILNI